MPRGTDRYDEALRQGQLWTPDQWRGTPKLAAWFDISDTSNKVQQSLGSDLWLDRSGNGLHARWGTNGTGNYDPIGWKAPSKLGPTILTNANNFAGFLSSAPAYSGATGYSGHVAMWHNGGGGSLFSAQSGGGIQMQVNAASPASMNLVRNLQANLFTCSAMVPVGHNVVGFDAASNYCALWANGTRETNSTDPAFSQPMNLLMNNAGGGEVFSGNVSEYVLSAQKLTDPENYLLQGYLAWKWGTVDRFASGHAFKNRPPLIGD